MNTHYHRCRRIVGNRTILISGSKITANKTILTDEYFNTQDKSWNLLNTSQGSKLRTTRPNIIKHIESNQWFHIYIHTYTYTQTSGILHISPNTVHRWLKIMIMSWLLETYCIGNTLRTLHFFRCKGVLTLIFVKTIKFVYLYTKLT